ncbi:hypothetical protein HIM_10360 [Hirsutella minnesotensis 3608]|uniref:Serine aminopeptidase S33 domain-containing protein n=1 Tax=Hirsutella minnesotensis 3608 TaxID=1043627 RepID=A0A0F7ZG44_9HYPO|nr:hypothetical protein HIM_10360 [Hirsutella minnesotensis 3608]
MRPRLALCALAAAASAYRAANFDISTDLALAYACGRQCQEAVAAGSKIDRLMFGDDFDFDFYASADNLTNSRPGNILKLEAMDATQRTFKKGTKAWRFQYTTVDLDGSLVPATAFIAFPSAVTGQSGHDNSSTTMGQKRFRLVAWAHGTSGLFRGCAPSNGPGLFDYGTWQPLVSRGYAVVATDYAGLGNDHTLHKYGSFRTHAADVYYSAVAARNVFGHALTREWMSAGHSQGGGAVWKLAESGLVRHDTAAPRAPRRTCAGTRRPW